MNIEPSQNVTAANQAQKTTNSSPQKQCDVKFSDELKSIDKQQNKQEQETKKQESFSEKEPTANEKFSVKKEKNKNKEIVNALDGLSGTLKELNELNCSDDNSCNKLKSFNFDDDIQDKENIMIDNDMNIRERELLNSQMNASMNFNTSSQSFSDFMNQDSSKEELSASAKDIAEEKAIMSTMAENYMIARGKENAQAIISEKKENADNIIMSRADVDFFAALVDKQELNIKDLTDVQKSSQVSKTLADMLADSMKNNKPLRIDFDNDISVIIKISKDGKISADFLPSSQIAEAYLRENLPLLKQKFDENNIDYNELNQRKQRQEQEKDNRKKGDKNE